MVNPELTTIEEALKQDLKYEHSIAPRQKRVRMVDHFYHPKNSEIWFRQPNLLPHNVENRNQAQLPTRPDVGSPNPDELTDRINYRQLTMYLWDLAQTLKKKLFACLNHYNPTIEIYLPGDPRRSMMDEIDKDD